MHFLLEKLPEDILSGIARFDLHKAAASGSQYVVFTCYKLEEAQNLFGHLWLFEFHVSLPEYTGTRRAPVRWLDASRDIQKTWTGNLSASRTPRPHGGQPRSSVPMAPSARAYSRGPGPRDNRQEERDIHTLQAEGHPVERLVVCLSTLLQGQPFAFVCMRWNCQHKVHARARKDAKMVDVSGSVS